MNIKKCFDTLGIPGDASLEEAKHSYKQLVKRWHPDRFGHDLERQQLAHKRLTEINVAYREIVTLLKSASPGDPSETKPQNVKRRHSEPDRAYQKKPRFFNRLASMFQNRGRTTDIGRGESSGTGQRTANQGYSVGRSGSTDFRKVLTRAIRNQPGRRMATSSGEDGGRQGHRKHVGRPSGTGTLYRVPSKTRGNRGDRVEKIEKVRPVRRVEKIGD